MTSFEKWWIKYYKYCVVAGVAFLAFEILTHSFDQIHLKSSIIFVAIVTSPVGALIDQALEWLIKLLKLLLEIFVEFLELRKAERR